MIYKQPKSTWLKAGLENELLLSKDNHHLPPVALDHKSVVAKQNLKTVLLWFRTWHSWQRRVFVCSVMESCTREQLELMSTDLEPALHFDFSTALLPPLAALHLAGAATFQVQRDLTRCLLRPEVIPAEPSLTVTFASSGSVPRDGSDPLDLAKAASQTGRDVIKPAVPLLHTEHATLWGQGFGDTTALKRRRFSSVPDFCSTSILRSVKEKSKSQTRHSKSKSFFGAPAHMTQASTTMEQFKLQLVTATEVTQFVINKTWSHVHALSSNSGFSNGVHHIKHPFFLSW